MFILHVDLSVKPGMTKALKGTYRDVFVPAISKHAALRSEIAWAISSEARSHRLVIAFESEELQENGWPRTFINRCGRRWMRTWVNSQSTTMKQSGRVQSASRKRRQSGCADPLVGPCAFSEISLREGPRGHRCLDNFSLTLIARTSYRLGVRARQSIV